MTVGYHHHRNEPEVCELNNIAKDQSLKDVTQYGGTETSGSTSLPPEYENEAATTSAHAQLIAKLATRWLTVEPVIAVYNACFSTLIPLVQQYIYDRMSREYNISTDEMDNKCDPSLNSTNITDNPAYDAFHADISQYNIIMTMMTLVPLLCVLPFIGTLSDTLGRKMVLIPALVSSIVGGALVVLVMALDLDLTILLIALFIVSMTGGNACVIFACYAYVCDVHTEHQRLVHILLIEFLTGLGTVTGQIVVGYLILALGFTAPTLIVQSFVTMALIYTLIFIPETVEKLPDRKFCTGEILTKVPRVLCCSYSGPGTGLRLILTTIVIFIVAWGEMGITTVLTFYLLDPPLCWTSDLIGIFNGVTFLLKGAGGVFLIFVLGKILPEPVMMLIGCISAGLYYLFLAASSNTVVPFIGAGLGFAQLVTGPSLRNYGSKLVKPDEQGALFAGFTWFTMFGMLLSSVLLNYVYAVTTDDYHGLVMALNALFFLLPMVLILFLWCISAYYERSSEDVNIDGEIVTQHGAIILDDDVYT